MKYLQNGSQKIEWKRLINRTGMDINTLLERFWRAWQLRKSRAVKWWLMKHELLSHMYFTTALSKFTSIIICLSRPPITDLNAKDRHSKEYEGEPYNCIDYQRRVAKFCQMSPGSRKLWNVQQHYRKGLRNNFPIWMVTVQNFVHRIKHCIHITSTKFWTW